jgi:hypothetical protein
VRRNYTHGAANYKITLCPKKAKSRRSAFHFPAGRQRHDQNITTPNNKLTRRFYVKMRAGKHNFSSRF